MGQNWLYPFVRIILRFSALCTEWDLEDDIKMSRSIQKFFLKKTIFFLFTSFLVWSHWHWPDPQRGHCVNLSGPLLCKDWGEKLWIYILENFVLTYQLLDPFFMMLHQEKSAQLYLTNSVKTKLNRWELRSGTWGSETIATELRCQSPTYENGF